MKHEHRLLKGDKFNWPVDLKIALFKASEGKFHFDIHVRPLFLFYLFVPNFFKFWLSIEKDVISVYYAGFIKMPSRWREWK